MMLPIIDILIKFRKQICPKTSYVTGGSAASTLQVLHSLNFLEENQRNQLFQGILETKEFEHIQQLQNFPEVIRTIDQNVLLTFSKEDSTDQLEPQLLELLKMKKTKLIYDLQFTTTAAVDRSSTILHQSIFKWNAYEEIYHVSKIFPYELGHVRLKVWYFHKIYKIPITNPFTNTSYASIPLGFNKQPAVSSRLQFRFLWNLWPKDVIAILPCQDRNENLLENKRRVLQRLADRSIYNPNQDGKELHLSVEEWDKIITQALEHNYDDWDIYSLIRQKTLGTSLEADTDPLSIIIPEKYSNSGVKSTLLQVDTQNNEERSDFLVDRIHECLPEVIREQPTKYISSFLDYGCAEGGITAALGKKLALPAESIFGADVRSITSKEFQFIPLASESKAKPFQIGQILPSLKNNAISLINSSMVYHHVMHIDHVLLELRRVINWEKGLLIVREHDCVSSASGAFLDIVHGLYSLAWQNPVEWPDFIMEYEAYYRSREEWNQLLLQNGFELKPQQPKLYDQAKRSVFNRNKNRFPNVVRAYQAIYIPKRDFPLTRYLDPLSYDKIPNSNNIKLGESTEKALLKTLSVDESLNSPRAVKRNRSLEDLENPSRGGMESDQQKKKLKSNDSNAIASYGDYEIYESKQYPGNFYKFYKYQDKSEWVVN